MGDPLTVAAGSLRVGFARFLVLVAFGEAARCAAVAAAGLWWAGP